MILGIQDRRTSFERPVGVCPDEEDGREHMRVGFTTGSGPAGTLVRLS